MVIFAVIMFPGLLLKIFPLFILFILLAVILTLEYTKIKAGKLKGFLLHFTYWSFGIIRFKRVPKSHIRYFNG